MAPGRSGRRPGESDTRGDILAAAREVFAEQGFDQATLREIARRAQVDPGLVHHYFGNKAGLFSAVGDMPVNPGQLLAGVPRDDSTGREIAARVLGFYESQPQARAALMGMMKGAQDAGRAGSAQLRRRFAETFHPAMRALVRDDQGDLRASLIASHLTGVVLGRYVVGMPGLAQAPLPVLVEAVGPALQHYVMGDVPT
jgi:AcrR family transcriptional regulator